jgi:hypothetical protein
MQIFIGIAKSMADYCQTSFVAAKVVIAQIRVLPHHDLHEVARRHENANRFGLA